MNVEAVVASKHHTQCRHKGEDVLLNNGSVNTEHKPRGSKAGSP